jgi:hypothetical protein
MRPFAAFVPLRKAHSFYGNSFAAKVIPIQNARTVLTRSILDHAVITNTPRYKVVKGGLDEPEGADGQPRWRHRQRDAA